MTDFTAAAAAPAGTLDPLKRVRYSYGLVLGVDEFLQEQHYHLERNRLHSRLLHGYGTVTGLAVEPPAADDPDAVLRVRPGVAVDALGREIVVPRTMCVKLARWLDRYRDFLDAQGLIDDDPTASPPLPPAARLAVVLCYRECETDTVPVPGEPCRAQEDAMEASRLADAFELRLVVRGEAPTLSPPDRLPDGLTFWTPEDAEERAVRLFGALLDRLGVAAAPGDETDRETLRDAVRALAPDADGAPDLASPPAGPLALPADPGEAAEALRDMFRVWVTEVRPRVDAHAGGAPGEADGSRCEPRECCVLLADLAMEVTAAGAVGAVVVDETERPYLLHTRLLQECVLHRALGGDGGAPPPVIPPAGGDAVGPLPALQVVGLRSRPVAAAAPAEGEVLTFAAGAWTPRALPTSPPPPAVTLAGDVTGATGATSVGALRGRALSTATPQPDEVLTWTGTDWTPRPVPPAPVPGGPFVPMPSGGDPIAVVAAGVFNLARGAPDGPVYGGLSIRRVGTAGRDVVLSFDEYVFPPRTNGRVTFVVKGIGSGLIRFVAFVDATPAGPGGIQIQLSSPLNDVDPGTIMIEITRIARAR